MINNKNNSTLACKLFCYINTLDIYQNIRVEISTWGPCGYSNPHSVFFFFFFLKKNKFLPFPLTFFVQDRLQELHELNRKWIEFKFLFGLKKCSLFSFLIFSKNYNSYFVFTWSPVFKDIYRNL